MKVPQLTGRQANFYAALTFVLTVAINLLLPGNTISFSGFLVVIFLSVFVHSKASTIIGSLVTSLVVTAFIARDYFQLQQTQSWPRYVFILILIFFTTLIVLYIKALIRQMQFDESHLSSLFENVTEGILLTNNEAKIILVNQAACNMFGYQPEELIGAPIEILIPQKFAAGHKHLRHGFYQHPQNRQMGSGRDLYGQKKDGSNLPVEVSLSAYKQRNQQYVIAFVVDITQRKAIEQSVLQQQQQLERITNDVRKLNAELEAKVEERTVILKEALQRLEQSQTELSEALDKERELNEIKSRFVTMASHEFRTPLSALLSSASLLAKYTHSSEQEKRDRHINRIKESVRHLNNLLDDFLSLGKLDEGKVGATMRPFNLKEQILDVTDEIKGILKQGQAIAYQHQGAEDVFTDRNLVKNIMINLLGNAAKFSDANELIQIESKVENDVATIMVKDHGIGISDEDQQHLFTSFFRGKNAQNIQGTGLGLHIVKRYTDLLGGTVTLHSKLNEGTTITFSFSTNMNMYAKNNIGN